jgi:hypothetical protein
MPAVLVGAAAEAVAVVLLCAATAETKKRAVSLKNPNIVGSVVATISN